MKEKRKNMKVFKEYLFLGLLLFAPALLFVNLNYPLLNNLPDYKVFYNELISGSYFHMAISVFYFMILLFFDTGFIDITSQDGE